MADFKSAFRQGLDATQKAQAAVTEIDEVFADLNRQLSELSGGTLAIERRRLRRTLPVWATPFQEVPRYWALVAYNPRIGKSPAKELCEWAVDKAGYPCKLSWGEQERYAENKGGLEDALSDLLRDPLVNSEMSYFTTKSARK